jgi:transcription elongation factor
MAIAYNWTIYTCEHEVATGGITAAHWRCNAIDGDYTAPAYGICHFTPDVSDPGFTPYDQVTKAEVLAWCWGNGVDKDAIEAALAAKIDAQENPVSASGTPW